MALEFDLNRDAPAAANFDCVVVGAFTDNTLSPSGDALDQVSGGRIRACSNAADVAGKTAAPPCCTTCPASPHPRGWWWAGRAGQVWRAQYLKASASRALR